MLVKEELGLIECVFGCGYLFVLLSTTASAPRAENRVARWIKINTKTKCHQTFTSNKPNLLSLQSAPGEVPIREFSLLCCQVVILHELNWFLLFRCKAN